MKNIKVFKIGGNVVDNPELLARFCRDFAKIPGWKILVHGGGVKASQIQKALGQEPIKIEGRRVTDPATLEVVTMVYAGLCNKTIVAKLQAEGCNAIGLSGCDGGVITARKRPPMVIEGREVDFGAVGDVSPGSVDVFFLLNLLREGFTPVLNAINHDGKGNLLNTNADTIASSVASSLAAELIICFEKAGVMLDKDDDSSVIPEIDNDMFNELRAKGKISDGMVPKLQNAFKAIMQGALKVVIKHSGDILRESGTTIKI